MLCPGKWVDVPGMTLVQEPFSLNGLEKLFSLNAYRKGLPEVNWFGTKWDKTPSWHSTGTATSIIHSQREIPWLFQANCCNFQHYQLGFTMNDQYRPYNNTSMRCPDPFRSDTGVAPPGHEFSITLFLRLA
ncbi:hypothetical protein EDC04DRAFT_2614501 [Pisolithus marmoratus]|nr:hypothetical protein EDC04DRAFT_2614501 [Pisolithus marmoratus]